MCVFIGAVGSLKRWSHDWQWTVVTERPELFDGLENGLVALSAAEESAQATTALYRERSPINGIIN